MKRSLSIIAFLGLVCGALLTGCQKNSEPTASTPSMPSTNAPAMTTNAPAGTNAPAQ